MQIDQLREKVEKLMHSLQEVSHQNKRDSD